MSKEKKEKQPQRLLKKQAEFAIRTFDTDTPIREDENTDCPGTTAYLVAATTTTTDNTATKPDDKVGNDIGKLTSLGTTGKWPKPGEHQSPQTKKNNPKTLAWINKTALGPAIIVNKKNAPIVTRTITTMTNSVPHLAPILGDLIKLITNSNPTIDGTCVMAVALHQQGIRTFENLQSFNYKDDFHNCFTTYKEHDTDVGTNSGPDIVIIQGIKMYIQWLIIWAIYREDDSDNDANYNKPNTWTRDEFRKFKTGCRNGTIIPISSILPTGVGLGNSPHMTDID